MSRSLTRGRREIAARSAHGSTAETLDVRRADAPSPRRRWRPHGSRAPGGWTGRPPAAACRPPCCSTRPPPAGPRDEGPPPRPPGRPGGLAPGRQAEDPARADRPGAPGATLARQRAGLAAQRGRRPDPVRRRGRGSGPAAARQGDECAGRRPERRRAGEPGLRGPGARLGGDPLRLRRRAPAARRDLHPRGPDRRAPGRRRSLRPRPVAVAGLPPDQAHRLAGPHHRPGRALHRLSDAPARSSTWARRCCS